MKSPAEIIKGLFFRYGTTFRRKALFVAIPGLIIASTVYTVDALRTETAIMKEEITKRAEVVAQLASRIGELPILSGNRELMKNAISSLKDVPEVSFVAFYDDKMVLLAESRPVTERPRRDLDASRLSIFEQKEYFDLYAPVVTVKAGDDLDILQDSGAYTDLRETTGWVRLGFSKASMIKKQQAIIARGLLFAMLFTAAISTLFYVMFTIATRPLSELHKALGGVRKGEYPEISISSNDEVGMLAKEYNRMADAVKDRETRLRESQKRTSELFERVEHAIFRLDTDGNVAETNRKFDELCGGTKKFSELCATDRRMNSLEGISSDIRNTEVTISGKDGQKLVVLMSIYPELDEAGRHIGFDGHFVDISEKKGMEEALFQAQKLESLGLLAGGVAHDFNNILTGILGYASLMKYMLPGQEVLQGYLGTIEKSARRAANLAGQLLGFARKGKYKEERLNITDIVNELVVFLKETVDRGIEIVLSNGKELPPVEGDGTQIYQALLNLCINARDAMPDGGKLHIKTDTVMFSEKQGNDSLKLLPGCYVVISVTDTGIGIEPEVKKRIFEPFFTTKEVGKGTGLGLAMVYGIINNHGGQVTVHSTQGLGTSFIVYLPVAKGKPEEKEQDLQTGEAAGQGLVLIVDDEEIVRSLGKDILQIYGYKVMTASHGGEGIRIFRENNEIIDFVLLDMVMPEKGGRQTFLEMREIDPEARIVLCSGYEKDHYVRELIEEGAMGFLQKPFHHMDLIAIVQETIGRYGHRVPDNRQT